jgi:cytochrome c-type biogenesis protein CcmH/NrfG
VKQHIIRDFWIALVLCYGVLGMSLICAEEPNVARATVLVNEGKADQAIGVLQQELLRDPRSAEAEVILGQAYLQQSNFDQARTAFQRAVDLQPDLVPARYNLALLCERSGDAGAALEAWEKVSALAADGSMKKLADRHIRDLEG